MEHWTLGLPWLEKVGSGLLMFTWCPASWRSRLLSPALPGQGLGWAPDLAGEGQRGGRAGQAVTRVKMKGFFICLRSRGFF